jgi:hypothetical protein
METEAMSTLKTVRVGHRREATTSRDGERDVG